MIYFLWQIGRFTNRKISELFGLSYPSVSRRVGIFRKKLRVDKIFKKKYDEISHFNQDDTIRNGDEVESPIFPQERLRGQRL